MIIQQFSGSSIVRKTDIDRKQRQHTTSNDRRISKTP